MRTANFIWFASATMAVFSSPNLASACEYCTPVLTLSEQLDQADAVALVKWISATEAELKPEEVDSKFARTTYEVVEIVKNSEGEVKKSSQIVLAEYRPGEAGDLAMLFAIKADKLEWGDPVVVTKSAYEYFSNAPDLGAPISERLTYYLDYLENPEEMIANDAYGEFASAPFVEIRKLKDQFPREKLRKWLADPDTAVIRLGLYGLMLGLSGTEDDAKLMKDRITEPNKDNEIRIGVDGIMAGYVILAGEGGLKVLEDTKLKAGVKVVPSETFAAMGAVRFAWDYSEKIEKGRLKKAMRLLLDRPEVADLAIADLARWKDWEIQDQLMTLYDDKEYEIPSIKRAIVRYLIAASKIAEDEKHAARAKIHLETLRKKDPKTVKQAERFFYFD